ncbi:AMP-binding protein [Labedaea rhizosphaerae]|uniref:Bile acid-coenzyme A ligase n=1 Tax=Labedaea rhizosphaerae TaxID=598644 RepID=A0A4V3CY63_LABRH|nr:AMP-binding protein [Labedaea rhizosphaerae]TDP92908.1 bile acid-coenzyme A ligase [Labedaea rhizosphaerae]
MSASIDTVLRDHADRIGDTTAIACCGRSGVDAVSWSELESRTGAMAAQLHDRAVDRAPACLVVSLRRNDLAEVLALVACLRTDLPTLVLSGRQLAPMHEALLDQVRRTGHTLVSATEPEGDERRAAPDGGATLPPGCLLLASGGSTGNPKLVVDRGIRATPRKPAQLRPMLHTGWRGGQRQLAASPLYHAAGLTPLVEGLVCGNTSYVPQVFDPAGLGELVDEHDLHWLQMTPFHMGAVLAGANPPSRWRRAPNLVHMAEYCPAAVKQAYHDALGATSVHEMYTASEGIGMTMARGDEWEARPGTVGRGFLTVVRIADRDGVPLGPQQTGEVYLRSAARTGATYFGATGRLRVMPDGFATLGDLGRLDEDGYLFLRARQVETISVAGVTVDPSDVETELRAHPLVADIGVCATSSRELGERVVAVVVPAGDVTEAELRRWARTRLTAAQLPARILFTDALPRWDTGKLDRAALFRSVNTPSPGKVMSCGST